MQPERNDPLIGTLLGGGFRVVEPIGVGAFAGVYLVEHQPNGRAYAAKVLGAAASPETRARFLQAANDAARLAHANIAAIAEVGHTADQRPFYVTELLRGQTVDHRVADGPLDIEEVVVIAAQVARALVHAHTAGVLHLDLRPENVFLLPASHGRWLVKVVDFVIAHTPRAPRVAGPGAGGNPQFMAPEVCRGDAVIDRRADVYSFGVLLYLLLCGRLPFADPAHRVLQMQLVQLPAPPSAAGSELSPEIAVVVERALADKPGDRYASIEALIADLAAALPPGADRLLLEAEAAAAQPEADPPRAARASQPPPNVASMHPSSPLTPISHTELPLSRPTAPRGRRASIVVGTALLGTLAGALVWHRLAARGYIAPEVVATPPHGDEPRVAMVTEPSPASASAAVTPAQHVAAARVEPPAAEDPGPAPEVAVAAPVEHEPARSPATRGSPGKALPARLKAVTRREAPPRPVKRTVVAAATPRGPGARALPRPAPSATPVVAPVQVAVNTSPAAEPTRPEPPRAARPEAGSAAPTAPSAPAVVAPAGSLDATPELVSLEVKGSLSPAMLRSSVERSLAGMRGCYRTAARAGGATPALELRLTFEIDENSRATQVATSGASFGAFASCAAGVAGGIRALEAPDVGTAQVSVLVRFRPS